MSDAFKIFNSILKTNLKKSDRFSNFKFFNSEIYGDGAGFRIGYGNGMDTVSVYLYDSNNHTIPDCSTEKNNIQSEILVNEFMIGYEGIENFLEMQGAEVLDFAEPLISDQDFPMIYTSFLFIDNDEPKFTQLYLTSIKNNFLKFRITCNFLSTEINEDMLNLKEEIELERLPIILNFLNDFTSLILTTKTNKQ